ncbi:Hypp2554 [Branchiostoma lanceolatum]|uniref:Hypp2554 protein n=1 Tax=Branchiostoma lanceolatum TaxID=7740 RepID=A0A8J9ZS63_BRALA|nr:Hypp2554 [Branchiostoma lanceolatum]
MDCPETCEKEGQVTNCSKEGTIIYSIRENVRDIFSISEETGVISTKWPFDKTTENYTLIIAATDQAAIPRSGTATVNIFVKQSLTTERPPQPTPGSCTDQQLQAENELLTYILYGVGAGAGLLVLITSGVTAKLIFSLRRIKNMSTAHLTTPAFRDPGAYEYLSAKTDYAYAEGKGDDDDDSQPPALPPVHTRPNLDSRRPSGTSIPRLSRAGIGYYTPPIEMTSFAGSSGGSRELLRNNDGDDLSIRDGEYLNMESYIPDYVNQHHDPYLKAQDDTSREIRYGYLPLNTREHEEQLPHSEYYNGHDRPGDTRYGFQGRQSRRSVDDSSEHDRPDYVRSGHRDHQSREPVMSNSQQQDRNNQHASHSMDHKSHHSHQDSSRPESDGKPWQYVNIHALQNRNNNQKHHPLQGRPRKEERSQGKIYMKNVQTPQSHGKDKVPRNSHHQPPKSGRTRKQRSGNNTDPLLSPDHDDFSGNQLQAGEVDLWGQFS